MFTRKVALIAATSFEIQPTIDHVLKNENRWGDRTVEILITGIGSLSTAYHVTNFLQQNKIDFIIQAGIAGTFADALALADTVLVGTEVMGDLGVEENGQFRDLFDLGFVSTSSSPYQDRKLVNPASAGWQHFSLPVVNGLTVNEISTRENRIAQLKEKYHCHLESMEGAAFHYVCLQQNVSFMQLRAISNYVGERNKSRWQIKQSIENLNTNLLRIIDQLP